jgi:hypothetical protein
MTDSSTDSNDGSLGGFFAPPAFKPADALVQLCRQLREIRPLTERTGSSPVRFEIAGQGAIELAACPEAIEVKVAKRLARSPEWALHTLKSSADVRKLLDDIKKRVANWADDRE